jgi:hypothetical protein
MDFSELFYEQKYVNGRTGEDDHHQNREASPSLSGILPHVTDLWLGFIPHYQSQIFEDEINSAQLSSFFRGGVG